MGHDPLRQEQRATEQSLLLRSPWPESVYAFMPIWSALAQRSRPFSIDLPGFGGSERRTTSCPHRRWVSSNGFRQ